MKTNLHFYLNDKAETSITSFYDCSGIIPAFKKGDRFYYSVEEILPRTISDLRTEFKEDFVKSIIVDNKNKAKLFNYTELKIISVYTSLKNDPNLDEDDVHRLRIEYKCKKIKRIYWTFWKTYKFKQFFNLK